MFSDAQAKPTRKAAQLERAELLELYYEMLLARRLDERCWALHRQGKVAFHISGIGQEALQVAAAHALRPGFDFVHAHYRDLALVLALGVTPTEFMMGLFGKKGGLSGGRQMPSHWSKREIGLASLSSPVGDHVPHAAGTALAEKIKRETGLLKPDEPYRVSLVNLGEGATSEGDWHEGLNWAGIYQLPFVCMVENNQYAISVPLEKQMAVKSVADRAEGYGMEGIGFDGNDLLESYDWLKYAIEKARRGGGPTLLEARTYRLVPHSSDDDDRTYRDTEEVKKEWANDPLVRIESYLREQGILGDELVEEYAERVSAEVNAAQHAAESASYPAPEEALGEVYAP
jgi:2-oxoisovalerate dehydrogenase E1 component alpha subunit